jgi:ATP-dependent protease HslVU (ClpYQ) peptidase subunit
MAEEEDGGGVVMSCCVGLVSGRTTWIGADSASGGTDVTEVTSTPKVFVAGDFVLAGTNSWRSLNLLRHWRPPARKTKESVDRFIAISVTHSMRQFYKKHGFLRKNDNADNADARILLAYNGRLFEMLSDFGVIEIGKVGSVVGSGYAYALGSLHATARKKCLPKERVILALEAAAEFCPTVREPFRVFKNDEEVL